MGKRSNFERRERDFYKTPISAARPLFPHLVPGTLFREPCAGDGALIRHLVEQGHCCIDAADIEPQAPGIRKRDALRSRAEYRDDIFNITNPPWDRRILHPLIVHLAEQAPTWLLFDADWAYTKQSGPYMPLCRKVVAIGRVKWIEGSKHTGKDNCAWYLFDTKDTPTQFVGRAA